MQVSGSSFIPEILGFFNSMFRLLGIKSRADQLEKNIFGEMWMKGDFEESGLKDYEIMTLWKRNPLGKADSKATEDNPSIIL